jgi:hypothetical protein
MLKCITETIRVTEGRKYFPRVSHAARGAYIGNPDVGHNLYSLPCRILLERVKSDDVWDVGHNPTAGMGN